MARVCFGCALCSIYSDMEETLIHLFVECPMSMALAFGNKWSLRLDRWNISNLLKLFNVCLVPSFLSQSFGGGNRGFVSFMACYLYTVWNMRNAKKFGGEKCMISLSGN